MGEHAAREHPRSVPARVDMPVDRPGGPRHDRVGAGVGGAREAENATARTRIGPRGPRRRGGAAGAVEATADAGGEGSRGRGSCPAGAQSDGAGGGGHDGGDSVRAGEPGEDAGAGHGHAFGRFKHATARRHFPRRKAHDADLHRERIAGLHDGRGFGDDERQHARRIRWRRLDIGHHQDFIPFVENVVADASTPFVVHPLGPRVEVREGMGLPEDRFREGFAIPVAARRDVDRRGSGVGGAAFDWFS